MFEQLEAQAFQIHLSAKGCSGRGIRYKLLSPKDKRQADSVANAKMGDDPTALKFFETRQREGMKMFITHITVRHSLGDIFAPDVAWQPVGYKDLNTGGDADLDAGKVLNSFDVEFLGALYSTLHEPTPQVVMQLMGEAKPLA